MASALALEAASRHVATLQTPGGPVEVSSYAGEAQIAAVMALICKDLSEPYSIFTFRYFLDAWPDYCLLAHAAAEAGSGGGGGNSSAPRLVGAILCKASPSKTGRLRGYVGMFAVDADFRRCGIGSALAALSVQRMAASPRAAVASSSPHALALAARARARSHALHRARRALCRAQGAHARARMRMHTHAHAHAHALICAPRSCTRLLPQRAQADCDEVVLETEVTNHGALRLYEGLGFTRDKLLAKYYLNGRSACVRPC